MNNHHVNNIQYHTWLYFSLSGVSPSFGPTMTEAAFITFLTPLKYSGNKVLSLVMSPMIWQLKKESKKKREQLQSKEQRKDLGFMKFRY